MGRGRPIGQLISHAAVLKQLNESFKPIPMKPITYLYGEPQVIWDQTEVDQVIINENLEYTVIGKFLYRWMEIEDLWRLISKQ